MGALFDCSNTALNFWDVFVFSAYIEFRLDVGSDGAAGAFKFRVTNDELDAETTFVIDSIYLLESLH
jgi:hypothetical protein